MPALKKSPSGGGWGNILLRHPSSTFPFRGRGFLQGITGKLLFWWAREKGTLLPKVGRPALSWCPCCDAHVLGTCYTPWAIITEAVFTQIYISALLLTFTFSFDPTATLFSSWGTDLPVSTGDCLTWPGRTASIVMLYPLGEFGPVGWADDMRRPRPQIGIYP